MRVLVTAGNTQTPIDDVRVITNVFTGRTGTQIAVAAQDRGHAVTLLTSHPELVADRSSVPLSTPLVVHPYRTFEDLQSLMQRLISGGTYDAIIHCAAVSDYELAGTYARAMGTTFNPESGAWQSPDPVTPPALIDIRQGKIKSSHPEIWMRLVPTPKLIDKIRQLWGFQGVLVKFKLEVGASDAELIEIAERSRTHSRADLMVANTHSGMQHCAFLGPIAGQYQRIERAALAARLLNEVESLTRR